MVNTQRRSPTIFIQILISIMVGTVITLFLLLLVNLGISLYFSGKIMPGVTMNGVSLSGLNTQQAASAIAATYNFPEKGNILLTDGDKNWLVRPVQLGVYLDPQASAEAAYKTGRGFMLGSALLTRIQLLRSSYEAQPTFIYDERAALNYLTGIAAQIDQPIREASLSMNGTDVVVTNGQKGRVLDIQATLDAVTKQVRSMQDGVVPLVIVEAAPAILDASAQAEAVRSILSQPFTLSLPSNVNNNAGPWQIDPSTLAQLLLFERVDTSSGSGYQITLNQVVTTSYLSTLEQATDQEPENARFIFNDDTKQLDLFQQATIGRKLNVDGSIAALEQALKNGEHTAALAFDISTPQITDSVKGSDLGITELVSSYTSYFYGSSPDRIHNIRTASERFKGLLVAPGATLSMSDVLGNISLDNGYAEALIILGDETIKGVGGGVCQVSTTLFRTAFFAGYPIVERHPHAYRVGYYEQTSSAAHDTKLAGLDATVFVPLVDFKFTNDTPYWLLMETYIINNSALQWKFYSTRDGRQVDWSTTGITNVVKSPEPLYRLNPDLPSGTKKQVDWAVEGADVTVTRTVTRSGSVLYQDNFFTRYEPWRDIWEYGPGTEIPTSTPTP
jgi:vancomycin resistance protein YoaR